MRDKNHHLTLRPSGWTCRVEIDGKEQWVALHTHSITVARARRDKTLEDIRAERWAEIDARRSRPAGADLETVAACYTRWAAGAKLKPRTARANVAALRNLIRSALGKELRDVQSSQLTADLLSRYQSQAVAAARPLGAGALNSALNSTHSIARQARSLFARKPMQRGAYSEIHLPDLAPFLAFSMDTGKTARPVPASSALLDRTRQVSRALRKRKPAHWIALQLAANLGLRRGSAIAAQWTWATRGTARDGSPLVHISVGGSEEYNAKGNNYAVQCDPALWDEIEAARQDPGAFILPGSETQRENVLRDLAKILRAIGWKKKWPVHELRRQAGMHIADEFGLLAAKDALGHSDTRVTTKHYVASMRPQAVRVI